MDFTKDTLQWPIPYTAEVYCGLLQKAKQTRFNPPPPRGGVGSDPPPPRFFRNNFFIYYCIDMKLGTPLRASIWRRLVQRKSKSTGNFLL